MAEVFSEPLKSFRFMVEAESDGNRVVAAFAQFSGVNMTVETIQARAGDDIFGVQEQIPVLTRFEPVTPSKGVVGDNEFMDWVYMAAAGIAAGPKGGKQLYRTLNVVAWDGMYDRGVIWTLKNALPIGYSLGQMDAGRSEVLVESLTFAIGGMDRAVME